MIYIIFLLLSRIFFIQVVHSASPKKLSYYLSKSQRTSLLNYRTTALQADTAAYQVIQDELVIGFDTSANVSTLNPTDAKGEHFFWSVPLLPPCVLPFLAFEDLISFKNVSRCFRSHYSQYLESVFKTHKSNYDSSDLDLQIIFKQQQVFPRLIDISVAKYEVYWAAGSILNIILSPDVDVDAAGMASFDSSNHTINKSIKNILKSEAFKQIVFDPSTSYCITAQFASFRKSIKLADLNLFRVLKHVLITGQEGVIMDKLLSFMPSIQDTMFEYYDHDHHHQKEAKYSILDNILSFPRLNMNFFLHKSLNYYGNFDVLERGLWWALKYNNTEVFHGILNNISDHDIHFYKMTYGEQGEQGKQKEHKHANILLILHEIIIKRENSTTTTYSNDPIFAFIFAFERERDPSFVDEIFKSLPQRHVESILINSLNWTELEDYNFGIDPNIYQTMVEYILNFDVDCIKQRFHWPHIYIKDDWIRSFKNILDSKWMTIEDVLLRDYYFKDNDSVFFESKHFNQIDLNDRKPYEIDDLCAKSFSNWTSYPGTALECCIKNDLNNNTHIDKLNLLDLAVLSLNHAAIKFLFNHFNPTEAQKETSLKIINVLFKWIPKEEESMTDGLKLSMIHFLFVY